MIDLTYYLICRNKFISTFNILINATNTLDLYRMFGNRCNRKKWSIAKKEWSISKFINIIQK